MSTVSNIRTLPKERVYFALAAHAYQYPDGDPSLWSVQNEALQGLREAIPEGDNAFLFSMFCGTGKTRTYIKLLELLSTFEHQGTLPKTIIVAPTRVLVRKHADEIARFSPEMSPFVGLYYAHEKDAHKPIVITTYTSFISGTSEGVFSPRETEIVVLDEAHEGMSEKRTAVIDAYKKKSFVLELSATPRYSSDRTLTDRSTLAYTLNHLQAIEKRVIAPFRNILLLSDADLDGVEIDGVTRDYSVHQLERAVNLRGRNLAAINFYKTFVDEYSGKPLLGQQGFFNCVNVKHAQDFSEIANSTLNKYMKPGIVFCEAVWGDMPEADFKDIIRRYEQGKILTLANCDLLIRGYDYPRASFSINLAPSRSEVVVGQRGGRPNRIDPSNPDKIAYIIDIVDQVSDPKFMPLLYGEYVNGATFGTIFDSEPEATIIEPLPDQPNDPDFKQTILVSKEEVMAFLTDRQIQREERLRSGIIVDRVLPSIRSRMQELDLPTIGKLYDAIKDNLPSDDELKFDAYKPTQARFVRIVTGVTSGWNTKTGEPTYEALALTELFECQTEDLFGEPPAQLSSSQKSSFPYKPDIHRAFIQAMKEAGYRNITHFRRELTHPSATSSMLANLSRGQELPISKETGDFTPLGHEIAMLLNRSPEELFGYDPFGFYETMSELDDLKGERGSRFTQTRAFMKPSAAANGEEESLKDHLRTSPWAIREHQPWRLRADDRRSLLSFDETQSADSIEPGVQIDKERMGREIRHILQTTLTPDELRVVSYHYGLGTTDSTETRSQDSRNTTYPTGDVTHQETAKMLGMTRLTVQRQESLALRKLRHQYHSKKLRGYLGVGEDTHPSFDKVQSQDGFTAELAWDKLYELSSWSEPAINPLFSELRSHYEYGNYLTLIQSAVSLFKRSKAPWFVKTGARAGLNFLLTNRPDRVSMTPDYFFSQAISLDPDDRDHSMKKLLGIIDGYAQLDIQPDPKFFWAWQKSFLDLHLMMKANNVISSYDYYLDGIHALSKIGFVITGDRSSAANNRLLELDHRVAKVFYDVAVASFDAPPHIKESVIDQNAARGEPVASYIKFFREVGMEEGPLHATPRFEARLKRAKALIS